MFVRESLSNLLDFLNNDIPNVILVEGARQVGKTTLVLEALKKFSTAITINLETDLITLKEIDATATFKEFTELLGYKFGLKDEPGRVLFIDEAQESNVLGRYVRSFKEEWKNIRVILSGSSMTRLFRADQRVPVGRYISLLITPLTFQEFLAANKRELLIEKYQEFLNSIKSVPAADKFEKIITETTHKYFINEFDTYLKVGGLPAVVKDFVNEANWRRTRLNILLSQEEDFVRKSGIQDKGLFSNALKGIANHLGFSSKFTHFSDNQYQAKKIMSTLQAWKIVFEVAQKGNTTTSRFFPKRYLYDIGIAQDLREHPFPEISLLNSLSTELRTPLGGLIENALYLQLVSAPDVYGISGWKTSSDENKEVDFVFKMKNVIPIECKASLKTSLRHFYGIKEYLKISGGKLGILASLAPFSCVKEEKMILINLPIYWASPEVLSDISMATILK